MTKHEIDRKFDEIVAFAEVEKFLDTPVKRYSSGMYVRLAFAVAAHLEPEILIVDEVLAVGDIAFQKKCLGKMEDVSTKEGRTILFVSHNMGQISSLCNKGILLDKGKVENEGDIKAIIDQYFNNGSSEDITAFNFENNHLNFYIKKIIILNYQKEECKNFAHDESVFLEITVCKNTYLNDVILGIFFSDLYDKKIFTTQQPISELFENKDTITFKIKVPHSVLLPNNYNFTVALHIPNIESLDNKINVGSVHIFDNGSEFYRYQGVDMGTVFMKCDWEF
jgi:lipopolysaccharide transport system ATP-binding protein